MTGSLFVLDGDLLVPTVLTRGPWSPDAQHGGPVAAALARAVEQVPTAPAGPMRVARITVELLRPAPLTPLSVTAGITRPGRKVQTLEATVTADGVVVARAHALRIRVADVPVPSWPPTPSTPSGPDAGERAPRVPADGPVMFHLDALDVRYLVGGWGTEGPATAWFRLTVPVVAGEQATPLQRTVAIADCGNGISRLLPFDTHTFINPDLTVALARPPDGEWIGMDSVTRLSDDGIGQAESLLFDGTGPAGRAIQSLYVDR